MDLSAFNLVDLVKMFFQKLFEMFNLPNLTSIDWGNLTGIIITTITVVLTSTFILWLIKAIGLYTMAKNSGDEYAFLAFIPFACLYTKGKIVESTTIFGIEIEHPEWLLPLLAASTMLPFMKVLTSLLFLLAYCGILYRIYQKQVPNFAIVLLVLSILLPILQPFFIFFIRNSNSDQAN